MFQCHTPWSWQSRSFLLVLSFLMHLAHILMWLFLLGCNKSLMTPFKMHHTKKKKETWKKGGKRNKVSLLCTCQREGNISYSFTDSLLCHQPLWSFVQCHYLQVHLQEGFSSSLVSISSNVKINLYHYTFYIAFINIKDGGELSLD